MKLNESHNAVSVYYPERDSPVKYEVELSESGATKGMMIGGMIGSKVPHPLGTPVGVVVGGVVGAIWGKAD
jgi:outer membrane lipoprotein SlyB